MTAPVRYVVRRQEYTPPVAGVRRVQPEKWSAVATFPKRADADAEFAKLSADFRRTQNPFQLGGPNLFYQTSLPPYALHDYLLDHDITPPPTATTSNPNYVFWWVKHNRTFTDDQRAVVWRACDKLKPFDVAEEDDRAAVWLVVENYWVELSHRAGMLLPGENPNSMLLDDEGFAVREAYRTRREAERAFRRRDDQRREESEDTGLIYFDSDGQSYDWATAPVFSVRKVAVADELNGTSAFLLGRTRQPWDPTALARADVWEQLRCGNECDILFAVGDGETADARMGEMARVARRTANPFVLVGAEFFRPPFPPTESADELPNGLTLEDAFAAVRRLDTTPPPPESNDLLADWYDQVVRWSPGFIDVIWGTFADFRLFEVVEVPLGAGS